MPGAAAVGKRGFAFSRTLAWVFGVGVPVAETIRRWDTLATTYAPSWLDDYCVGAFLLFGAWAARAPADGRALTAL